MGKSFFLVLFFTQAFCSTGMSDFFEMEYQQNEIWARKEREQAERENKKNPQVEKEEKKEVKGQKSAASLPND